MCSPKLVFTLLVVSIALLSSLIPGGPVENRDFSHLPTAVILSFNIFLVCLLVTSTLSAMMIWRGWWLIYAISSLCGLGYFAVYALDLGEIFPVSPTPMSQALLLIEIAGLVISVPLTITAGVLMRQAVGGATADTPQITTFRVPTGIMLLLGAMAVAAVAFGTTAILNPAEQTPAALVQP